MKLFFLKNLRRTLLRFLCVIVFVYSILSSCPLTAQEVLSQVDIQHGAFNDCYEYMIHDQYNNYYVGLDYGTSRDSIKVGNSFVYAHRNDPINNFLYLSDFYFLKFGSQHELSGSFVIDNAEMVRDFHSDGHSQLISMTLFDFEKEDSLYPITLGGDVVLEREGHRGKGVLIVLNENMQLEKTIFPSTGELGQIVCDGNFAYLEILIPEDSAFILIGADTVFNQPYVGNPDHFDKSIVLCKYDFIHDKAVWWQRIGNKGDEYLQKMFLDNERNLWILGLTSSKEFYFNDTSYLVSNSAHNPFIGKYSSEGKYLIGILNSNFVNEFSSDILIDSLGNIYKISEYYGPTYTISDTALNSELLIDHYAYRGIVVKYDMQGNFIWARQLEGAFDQSSLWSISLLDENKIIISGTFREGGILFGSESYSHLISEDKENAFLWILQSENGEYLNHVMTEGIGGREIYNLHQDENNVLNLYLLHGGSDTIFNSEFSNYDGNFGGFLVKLSTDFLSLLQQLDFMQDKVHIFPNPVHSGGKVNFEFDQTEHSELYQYAIFNQMGQQVHEWTLIESDTSHNFSMQTSNFVSGMYWIVLRNKKFFEIELLVIE